MNHKISILSTAEIDGGYDVELIPTEVSLTIIPFVQIVYKADDELRCKVNEIVSSKATIVFTSKHAVKAVAKLIDRNPKEWTIYCLGKYTYLAIQECFANCIVTMLGNNASEMGALLVEKEIPEVVFFCGDKRLDTLPMELTDAGVKVNELVVYSNVECTAKIAHSYDGILFYSPSAVNSFFRINTVDPKTVFFAIGDTTAAAIYEYTTNNVVAGRVAGKMELFLIAIDYLM